MPKTELITALAVLKANTDSSTDFIDNFTPFISEAIRLDSSQTISTSQIHNTLIKHFKIKLPHAVIKTILSRLAKKGTLQKKGHILTATKAILQNSTFKEKTDQITRKQEILFKSFKNYCKKYDPQLTTCTSLEDCFYSYISSNLLDIIRFTGQHYRKASNIQCVNAHKINQASATFLDKISNNNTELFSIVEDIVKGNMVLNGLYYSGANEASRHFNRTLFFLDTPIILLAADIGSEARCSPYKELISLLKKTNAVPACFKHTIDEATNILSSASYQINKPNNHYTNETLQYFIDNQYTQSDIEFVISTFSEKVQSLGIRIKDKLPLKNEYVLNEVKLENRIEQEIHYHNKEARLFDLDSIAATYRWRAGTFPEKFEDSKATFVTTNTKLVKAIYNYFEEDFPKKNCTTICVTAHRLTHIAWAKLPTGAPELPKKLIISQCCAALYPSTELWEKYLAEIEKMYSQKELSSDSYTYLKYSSVVRKTINEIVDDVTEITSGTVHEIMQKAKRKEHEDLLKKLHTANAENQKNKQRFTALKLKLTKISKITSTIIFCIISLMIYLIPITNAFDEIQKIPPTFSFSLNFIGSIKYLLSIVIPLFLIFISNDLKELLKKGRNNLSELIFRGLSKLLKIPEIHQ